jgi:hypothetical protein
MGGLKVCCACLGLRGTERLCKAADVRFQIADVHLSISANHRASVKMNQDLPGKTRVDYVSESSQATGGSGKQVMNATQAE